MSETETEPGTETAGAAPASGGVTRRDALLAAGTVGAVGAGALGVAGVIGLVGGSEQQAQATVVARRVRAPAPIEDPGAAAWAGAAETVVPLLPQQLVPPSLATVGVAELRVRALHDATHLALRLSWDDATIEDLDGIGQFHDAVAVMLPAAGTRPPITMGAPGSPVHILQWRATWQRDIDSEGKTGVDQIYPRVVHDVMPDDVLPPATASLYWVGRAVGNPLSQKTRTTPVEQIVAEGFGSSTHLARDDARGRGVNDGSAWSVVVGFPLARPGVAAPLRPGSATSVAFAVWLGSQSNRGGRKHYADWVQLRLEEA